MGGKALKIVHTERCSNEKYLKLCKELVTIMFSDFTNLRVVKNYKNKESHGDIDIICVVTDTNFNIDEYINRVFKPGEIFHNGNCHSFDYDSTQIDLITCKEEDFESYCHYYDYGFGNYFGKIAQSIGFKYGMEGLWINHIYDSNNKFKIMVSKDFRKIFEFLGYDYDRFTKGFQTIEDIYDYVMTSKYYTPWIFQIENLTKVNRGRDVRRQSYMGFLTYISGVPHEDYDKSYVSNLKSNNISVIKDKFPECDIDLHTSEINYKMTKKQFVSTKFNGKMIIKEFGISGKLLGECIKKFKEHIEFLGYEYDEYIISRPRRLLFKTFKLLNEESLK
tara:strand:+ start:21916 stop:22917 length:1002 start_codon:yes stop_codon:yes gene_type:complete